MQSNHSSQQRRYASRPDGNRRVRILLCLIWSAFLLRGVFYCAMLPLWEGHDEFAHFSFVQNLVVHGDLPGVETRFQRDVEESILLTPLAWAFEGFPPSHVIHDEYWRLPEQDRMQREAQLRRLPIEWQSQPGNSRLYEATQPPLNYYLLSTAAIFLRNTHLFDRVFVLRILNLVIASLVIPLAFITARFVFRDDRFSLSIAALLAAMPHLLIDVSRVSNESLSIVLYTTLAYLLLHVIDGKWRMLLPAGIVLGLGLLTKVYFVAALPPFASASVIVFFRSGRDLRKQVAAYSAFGAISVLAIAGWWFWRNSVLMGSPDVLPQSELTVWGLLARVPEVDWMSAFKSILGSHLWNGAWSFLTVRSWMYQVLEGIGILALLGCFVLYWSPSGKRAPVFPIQARHLFILGAAYALFWAALGHHVLMMFVNRGIAASGGWYLYAVVVPEVLLVASGLVGLLRNYAAWGLTVLTGLFALLEFYTVHMLLIPYYTGMIAHAPDGGLRSFQIPQLFDGGATAMFHRLLINKAEVLTPPVLAVLWVLFVLSLFSLVVISVVLARRRQTSN